MGNIKYGTSEYFTLLDLEDRLKRWDFVRLDLLFLDKLRTEITMKIEAIHMEAGKVNYNKET